VNYTLRAAAIIHGILVKKLRISKDNSAYKRVICIMVPDSNDTAFYCLWGSGYTIDINSRNHTLLEGTLMRAGKISP
jgi:hypothetical protein